MQSAAKTEQGAKATPVEILRTALSSKSNFTLFIFNPKNSLFCGLSVIAVWLTTNWVLQVTVYHPGHVGNPTLINGFVIACLWFGVVSTLFQVTIQESINRFRALNGRLQQDIDGLSNTVNGLHEMSEKFKSQLEQFADIRLQMEDYAKGAGLHFDEVFSNTAGVFENMKKVQTQQAVTLLRKTAADVEFMDNCEGLNLQEWKRFCLRAPQPYKDKLQHNQEATFKSIAGNNEIAEHEEFMRFVEDLINDGSNPQADH